VVDSTDAVIVWEPRRVVASYAVPVADVAAQLAPYSGPVRIRPRRARGGPSCSTRESRSVCTSGPRHR
jgi:hypothetical protein